MHYFLFRKTIEQIDLFNLGIETSLGEGKTLNSNSAEKLALCSIMPVGEGWGEYIHVRESVCLLI